jgi:beta-glucosidase/6-phospho-beta-glucosidase/beta-galactosidase
VAEFLFATGIESSYPTIENGRWRMDELDACGHYREHRRDLELVSELGLRYLRYGPPLHRVFLGPGRYDWSFVDDVTAEMRELGIAPIMDLCHFGVPDWLESFQNPELPGALGEYAEAFARRYPFVRFYTPINEIYVAARRSALDGAWNEQLRDETAFVTATVHLVKATILMMRGIRRARPDAVFVHSESSELYQACCPDPKVRRVAKLENERRFLALDLLFAHPVDAAFRERLPAHGVTASDYEWFLAQDDAKDSILGIDYYDWNEKLIDKDGQPRALGELFGWYVIAMQYWNRYRRPLMHTETNCPDSREAPAWLWRQWHNVERMRADGVPVIGFTWYSLIDQVDWDVGLSSARGVVNPVGLFDLNRDARPVADAYRQILGMYQGMDAELVEEP